MTVRGIAAGLLCASLSIVWDAQAAGIDEVCVRPASRGLGTEIFTRLLGREEFRKSYAIIVGVGDYDHFRKLSAPAHDAIRMRNFLRDEAGFDHIITLTDDKANRARIERIMDVELPQLVEARDRVLFYFSGHGETRTFPDGDKRGYLVLKPSAHGHWSDMLDMPRVHQWAKNVSHARHAFLLLDACFSGLTGSQRKSDPRDQTINRLMQPGHHILTAGVEGEESYASDTGSFFTNAFLNGARGDADYAGDGIISLSQMTTYISRSLDAKRAEYGARFKMTPHQWDTRFENNRGEFFFLKPAAGAQTSRLNLDAPRRQGDSIQGKGSESGETPPVAPQPSGSDRTTAVTPPAKENRPAGPTGGATSLPADTSASRDGEDDLAWCRRTYPASMHGWCATNYGQGERTTSAATTITVPNRDGGNDLAWCKRTYPASLHDWCDATYGQGARNTSAAATTTTTIPNRDSENDLAWCKRTYPASLHDWCDTNYGRASRDTQAPAGRMSSSEDLAWCKRVYPATLHQWCNATYGN